MIAGGAESMSMVPMRGNKPSLSPQIFDRRREHRHRLRHGPDRREGRRAVEGQPRGAGRVLGRVAPRALAAQQAGEFNDEIDADRRRSSASPISPTGEVRVKTRTVASTKARAPTRRSKAWPSCARCSRPRARSRPATARRRRDGAGALILVSEKILKQFDLTPLARFVSFAVRGVPPEIMGIGPIEAIPAALKARRPEAGRHRLDRAERSVRRAVAGGDSGPRPRSGEGQSDGRRDRARPPARRDRRDPRGDGRARACAATT